MAWMAAWRAAGTSTEFGVQLSNLADMVSFGMAPRSHCYAFFTLGIGIPTAGRGLGRMFRLRRLWGLRLARFNVQVSIVDSRFSWGCRSRRRGLRGVVILCWRPARVGQTRLLFRR